MIEDLSKTRSLVSLFILVVLRWIESRSRFADGRMLGDQDRDSQFHTITPWRTAEGLRNQTQVYCFSFHPMSWWTTMDRLLELGTLKFMLWMDWLFWRRTLLLMDILWFSLLLRVVSFLLLVIWLDLVTSLRVSLVLPTLFRYWSLTRANPRM